MGWWERAKQRVLTGVDRISELIHPWTGDAAEVMYLEDLAKRRNFEAMMPRQTVGINFGSRDAVRLRPSIIQHYAEPGVLAPHELASIGPQNIANIRQAARELYPMAMAQREANWAARPDYNPLMRPLAEPITVTIGAQNWGHAGDFGHEGLRPNPPPPPGVTTTVYIPTQYDSSVAMDLANKTDALSSVLIRLDDLSGRIEGAATAQNAETARAINTFLAGARGRPAQAVPVPAAGTTVATPSTAGPVGRPPLPPEELAKRQEKQRQEKNRKRREERAARRAASEDTGGL